MYDLRKSWFSNKTEKRVSPGNSFTEEGQCAVLDTAVTYECYKQSAAMTDHFGGFALIDTQSYSVMPRVEDKTVPSSGTLTVQMDKTTPVLASVSILITYTDGTTGWMVYDATPDDPADYNISASGLLTFYDDVLVKGATVNIRYKYSLTVEEANRLYWERSVNNKASATLGQFTLGYGEGEIFTSEYYSAAETSTANANFTAVGNYVTIGASGLIVPYENTLANRVNAIGYVIKPPTASDPLLGIHFRSYRVV